jgi:hypothetical protein
VEKMDSNFSEIVYNPALTATLLEYFRASGDEEKKSVKLLEAEITKMIVSGTVKPIIFTYLVTCISMLRMTPGSGFDIRTSNTLERLRVVLKLIFGDDEYSEKVLKQLFSFCILSSGVTARSEALQQEVNRVMDAYQDNVHINTSSLK